MSSPLAALLFLNPRTLRLAAMALLVIFTFAFGVHLLQGQFAASLLVYAAGVYLVFVHGPVSRAPAEP